jgi:uncharacterized membrane protein YsdA (DUF1294 family)
MNTVAAIASFFLVCSLASFVLYGLDKSAARRGRRRTPELTLHTLGLLGGWPGAFVAQRVFHHKSRKLSFQVTYWLTVVVNCSAIVWMLW